MNIRPISEWTIYRLRFVVGYGLLALLVGALLAINLTTIPPGLGASEQQSVLESVAVSFTHMPANIVDIPYHAIQKISVEFFGLTPLGVRLPSLIFGVLTALFMALVLKRWFKPNVAIAGGFIILSSAWFLGIARLGSPEVMIPFWTSLLILAATYASQETKAWPFWRVLFALSAAVSLYTPYMAYLFIATILASFSQPHLRYLIREGGKGNLLIGGFFFALILAPLGWGLYQDPSQARTLLAIPSELPDPLQFLTGLWLAASNFVNPYNVQIGEHITPVLSLAAAALAIIGGARLLRDVHAVRAHVLLIWAALLIPIVGLNPNELAVLLIPTSLVICIGLNQIIRYWYRLFPRNPYARIFGLLPLAALLVSIIQFNHQRYIIGMMYSPQTIAVFDRDPFIARSALTDAGDIQVTLVVPRDEQPIYEVAVAGRQGADVVNPDDLPVTRTGTWIVADEVQPQVARKISGNIQKLLVTDVADDARRFWVYQR